MERLLLGLEAIEDGGGGGGGGDCQQHTQGDAKDHPAGVISHKPPLMFIVFLPVWRETIGWRLFANSSVLSRTFNLLVRDTNGGDGDTGVDENEDAMDSSRGRPHYYTEGTQYRRSKERYRVASFDTSVFFLQNEAARVKWPVREDAGVEEELRRAFGVVTNDEREVGPKGGGVEGESTIGTGKKKEKAMIKKITKGNHHSITVLNDAKVEDVNVDKKMDDKREGMKEKDKDSAMIKSRCHGGKRRRTELHDGSRANEGGRDTNKGKTKKTKKKGKKLVSDDVLSSLAKSIVVTEGTTKETGICSRKKGNKKRRR